METNKPLVSIIIPTYNRAETLSRSIQSVLSQTYNDFELLIIDDCSTDNTEEILMNFKDGRIRYYRNSSVKGAALSRNIGIEKSQGEYIAFLDSDDIWFKTRLQKTIEVAQVSKDINFVFCTGFIKVGDKVDPLPSPQWLNSASSKEIGLRLYKSNFVYLQGVLIKKDVLLESGCFDCQLPIVIDYDLWQRLIPMCNVKFVDQRLFMLNVSYDCISKKIIQKIICSIKIFKKNSHILKRIIGINKLHYFLVKLKYISNIFNTVAWDLFKREKRYLLAIFSFVIAFLVYPNKQILNLRKRTDK